MKNTTNYNLPGINFIKKWEGSVEETLSRKQIGALAAQSESDAAIVDASALPLPGRSTNV